MRGSRYDGCDGKTSAAGGWPDYDDDLPAAPEDVRTEGRATPFVAHNLTQETHGKVRQLSLFEGCERNTGARARPKKPR
ncbi:MAG: hypothetical protein PHO92_00670 [Candidatus Peribacteraceae bacterium]|nr:hypothetical protein [Candidatus Peribacteraceae bacterium]